MLRSQLFKDNDQLKRCAVDNTAHVKTGDKGDFVSKIQEALVILDDAIFLGTEVSDQRYGTSTAQAVLDYKTKRNIVNRSYQSKPDNIVGVMTIAQMDKELADVDAAMPEIIRRARVGGFQRTIAAFLQVGGNSIPAPTPGRIDLNEVNRRRARDLAIAIFNNSNPDMDDISQVLGEMKDWTTQPNLPIELGHFPDPRCGNRDAFVVGNRVPIILCPRFFGGSEEQRIRTMVHESAHLTGVGDPQGESYYFQFNSMNEDPRLLSAHL